jgi:hypothetical protein
MKKRWRRRSDMKLNDYTLLQILCARCPSFAASLVMSFTFLACDASSPSGPILPSAPEEFATAVEAGACPSFDEACAEGREFVESACPLDGKYKKPSEYRKCKRQAVDSYLDGVASCFSPSELNSLRRCILSSLPIITNPSGGTAKDHFHSDE